MGSPKSIPPADPCSCADPENCTVPLPGCRSSSLDTHGLALDFGKHRGEMYTRAPINYLRWMCDAGHSRAHFARSELARRNVRLTDFPIDISGHAVDSASLRLHKTWRELRNKDEGLHAWLLRLCIDALGCDEPDDEGRLIHHGVRLVFHKGEIQWTLKTCMMENKK